MIKGTWLVVSGLSAGLTASEGVQSVEDAVLAAEAGADGILISNHGGEYTIFGATYNLLTER